jgi:hypothetical protein
MVRKFLTKHVDYGGRRRMPMKDPVNASLDRLLRAAINGRRLVTFMLDEHRRIAEPHDYGVYKGLPRLFFYQTGGESRSEPRTGWRWAELSKISQFEIRDDRFAGPRPAPSGRHIQWDVLLATVSPRPVLQTPPGSPTAKPRRRHITRPDRT